MRHATGEGVPRGATQDHTPVRHGVTHTADERPTDGQARPVAGGKQPGGGFVTDDPAPGRRDPGGTGPVAPGGQGHRPGRDGDRGARGRTTGNEVVPPRVESGAPCREPPGLPHGPRAGDRRGPDRYGAGRDQPSGLRGFGPLRGLDPEGETSRRQFLPTGERGVDPLRTGRGRPVPDLGEGVQVLDPGDPVEGGTDQGDGTHLSTQDPADHLGHTLGGHIVRE